MAFSFFWVTQQQVALDGRVGAAALGPFCESHACGEGRVTSRFGWVAPSATFARSLRTRIELLDISKCLTGISTFAAACNLQSCNEESHANTLQPSWSSFRRSAAIILGSERPTPSRAPSMRDPQLRPTHTDKGVLFKSFPTCKRLRSHVPSSAVPSLV